MQKDSESDRGQKRGPGKALTIHGNSNVGLLERGGVIDAVAGHADDVATALEDGDDLVLVLGEDLCEAVRVLHQRVHVLDVRQLRGQVPLALLGLK